VLLRCGLKTLDLSHPVVMGVLNITPDSFSDGGNFFFGVDGAVAHGLKMVEEGAAIIDVGGESTRPGAEPVGVEEELQRVLPVVERLRQSTDAIISVDTSKPEVIRAVAAGGAGLINDVRALREKGALDAVVASGCAVCLMHMKGNPRTMQKTPFYVDVVEEVKEFLDERVDVCLAAGVAPDRIVIDPGFGFGKTLEHNLQLLRYLRELASDRPVLVGLSRKSMVGRLTGRPPEQRIHGSVALAVMAVVNGARIVRVHDVAATVDALKTVVAVQGG
jgi:dihydropteroate synthase